MPAGTYLKRTSQWTEKIIQEELKKARSGDIESQYLVGSHFLETNDLASAFEWFRTSAEKGHWVAGRLMNCHFPRETFFSQFDDETGFPSVRLRSVSGVEVTTPPPTADQQILHDGKATPLPTADHRLVKVEGAAPLPTADQQILDDGEATPPRPPAV